MLDIIVIAICAVICGAETWVDIANFGKAREQRFKKFLELPNEISAIPKLLETLEIAGCIVTIDARGC